MDGTTKTHDTEFSLELGKKTVKFQMTFMKLLTATFTAFVAACSICFPLAQHFVDARYDARYALKNEALTPAQAKEMFVAQERFNQYMAHTDNKLDTIGIQLSKVSSDIKDVVILIYKLQGGNADRK